MTTTDDGSLALSRAGGRHKPVYSLSVGVCVCVAGEAKAGSQSGRGRQRSCSPALLKNLKHVLWQS